MDKTRKWCAFAKQWLTALVVKAGERLKNPRKKLYWLCALIITGSQVNRKLLKWETLSCNTVFQGKGRETVPELFQARLAGTVGNVGYCSRKAWVGAWTIPALLSKGDVLTKHLQNKNNFIEVSESWELNSGTINSCYHGSQDTGLASGTGTPWNWWSRHA